AEITSDVIGEIIIGSIEEDLDLRGGAADITGTFGTIDEPLLYTNVTSDECLTEELTHLFKEAAFGGGFPFNRPENHFFDLVNGLPRDLFAISQHAASARDWATTSTINKHTWD